MIAIDKCMIAVDLSITILIVCQPPSIVAVMVRHHTEVLHRNTFHKACSCVWRHRMVFVHSRAIQREGCNFAMDTGSNTAAQALGVVIRNQSIVQPQPAVVFHIDTAAA